MSLVSAVFGTDDDEEILGHLGALINSTAGLGLIHESVSISVSGDYTRSWFAWAVSTYGLRWLSMEALVLCGY